MHTHALMQLYRVIWKVRPATNHPVYWEWQFGRLCIWVFGNSPKDAAHRSSLIVEQLPYEIADTRCATYENELAVRPEFVRCEKIANETGLAIFLVACPTGTDESDFENAEP